MRLLVVVALRLLAAVPGLTRPVGTMAGLGTLPDGLNSQAMDINDRGQVGGYGYTVDSHVHAFLWEPH